MIRTARLLAGRSIVLRFLTLTLIAFGVFALPTGVVAAERPTPLAATGVPVDWMFAFKLNAATFASSATDVARACPFGGDPHAYSGFSQQYAFATSQHPTLQAGTGLIGSGVGDPLGATFDAIYRGHFHYVVWNDQFYRHPEIAGCGDSCGAPWGHSKGLLAWNEAGEGVVLQVTTPSWPAAGSIDHPREGDGDTLGCIEDNNVKVSQHFFSLRLSPGDVEKVVDALANASVVTDPSNPSLVNNGGPAAISSKVAGLGVRSPSTAVIDVVLSTGVRLIGKPSALHVPAWQLVSSVLGGVDLRTATWWANPMIPSTKASTPIPCWSPSLKNAGAVAIATTGMWNGRPIGLKGGISPNSNHAKIGVSTSGSASYTVFGDMNQQGALSGNCGSSQNGRGGLFFVLDNKELNRSVSGLIAGETAPEN